jgi:hypothetical protein
MATHMILNNKKGVTIKQGVGRVIDINETLPGAPCLKHKEATLV